MRKKREFIDGTFYHVTSRTNDKIRVFENKLGQRIMLLTLQDAKDKYHFKLTNFCVMPTHIHLLIKPVDSNLSKIMQWIKAQTAKRWNFTHGSTDHLWGHRFFERPVRDHIEYEHVMNYIDENPVKAGLADTPSEWKASGTFYRLHDLELVDSVPYDYQPNIKQLSFLPFMVSQFLPAAQLKHIQKYFGVYAEKIDKLFETVQKIPLLSNKVNAVNQPAYLHYYTSTADYFVCEYDGNDLIKCRVCIKIFQAQIMYQEITLSKLLNNPHVKLDLSCNMF